MKTLLWIACFFTATSLYADGSFFYLGVDGGYVTGIQTATRQLNVGVVGSSPGVTIDPTPRAGYDIGGNIGYSFPCLLRTDVSYHYQRQSYDWHAAFLIPGAGEPPSAVEIFSAKLGTNLVLGNLYLHLSDLCPSSLCSNLDPYLQGGVGIAFNRLYDILDVGANAEPIANIKSKTVSQLAFRFGIGLFAYSSCLWIVDAGLHVTYIGDVRSGNTQTTVGITPVVQSIRPYKFENNWIGTFNVGIKFGGRS